MTTLPLMIGRGLASARPAAGVAGRLYYSTDTGILERDSGSAWQSVEGLSAAPSGAAGGVLSGTFPNPGFAADMATQAELDAAIATAQPLDSDLTALAGLTPSNDDVLQRKAGAWTNRTVAQLKADLALNPLTTQDDLYVGGASGAPARLAKGSDGQVLTVDPSTHHLAWATPTGGGGGGPVVRDGLGIGRYRTQAIKVENSTVATTATATLATLTGSGMVLAFDFVTGAGATGAIKDGIIEVFVDGEMSPSIAFDLGTLGSHFATQTKQQTDNIGIEMKSSGPSTQFSWRFPIPYGTGLVLKFTNPAGSSTQVWCNLFYTEDVTQDRRLKSAGITYANADTVTPGGGDYDFLDLPSGNAGSIVWHSMTATGASDETYMEPNVVAYIDGEVSPSIASSGTEDWFASSFYFTTGAASTPWAYCGLIDHAGRHMSAALDLLAWCGGLQFTDGVKLTWEFGESSTDADLSYLVLYYLGTDPATNPGLVWRGDWDTGEDYAVNDAVQHDGSAYIATTPNSASEPPSGDWALLAARGDDGGITAALDDLTDVDAASPADGDVLTFDSGSGNWEAAAPAAPPSGSTVAQYGPLYPLYKPVVADFAWVNQGSATATDTDQGVVIEDAAAATTWGLLAQAPPSGAPWSVTLALMIQFAGFYDTTVTAYTSAQAGVGFRESGSGKLAMVALLGRATLELSKWSSPTAFAAAYGSGARADLLAGIVFVRLSDDNTNRKVEISRNGVSWALLHSVGRTDYLTADQIVIGVEPETAGRLTQLTLLSYDDGTPTRIPALS